MGGGEARAAAGLILGLVLTSCASARAPSPRPEAVSYDGFMKAERPPRGEAFQRLSPEDRAEIMKTHMRRWQAAHASRLRPEQEAVIAENLATLSAEFYREPTSREWRDRAIRLFRKAEAVFSAEEMRQLFTLDGEHIPAVE